MNGREVTLEDRPKGIWLPQRVGDDAGVAGVVVR
jgi:hypothetical protein